MSSLRERVPAQSAMQKVLSFRGTDELRELPFGILKPSRKALNWIRGVRGELEMSRELGALGEDWMVLHSIPVSAKGHDIDHLVVGPAGVFPINSKRLVDKKIRVKGAHFVVDDSDRDYLQKSYEEAKRVEIVLTKAGLSAPIVPILAVSGARRLRAKTPKWKERHIGVVPMNEVVRRIRKRPEVLDGDHRRRVALALLNPDRWTGRAPVELDPERIRQEYDAIERGVSRWSAVVIATASVVMLLGTVIAAVWIGLVAGIFL